MFREAIEAGRAHEWVVQNIDTIEIVERKMYNKHDFIENFVLALQFPAKVRLPE
ncbi:MAG: hypothetical protein ACI841_000115 [Planctomycetota bacterium]|jgi:hypothetical protein